MTRPDKASEPSMEEILASIRKIIAEEPIGSRPSPAPLPALPDNTRSPRLGAQKQDRGEPGMLPFPERGEPGDDVPYSVEDALADLIEEGPDRNGRPAAKGEPDGGIASRPASPAADDSPRPGWLFARPSVPAPTSAPASPGVSPRLGSGSTHPLDLLRHAPHVEPAARGEAGQAAPKPFSDLPLPGLRPSEPALDDPKTTRPGVAQGLLKATPSREEASDSAVAKTLTDNAASDKPPAAANGSATPETPPKTASAAPVSPGRALEAASDKPVPSRAPAAAAEPPKPVTSSVEAAAAKPAPGDGAKRPELSALDTLAQGLAGAKPPAKPAAASKPPVTPAPEQKASPGNSGGRSLEDTVAEMLRPMLREWLDANMPRIVEKALRVELAANAQRPGKSEQS